MLYARNVCRSYPSTLSPSLASSSSPSSHSSRLGIVRLQSIAGRRRTFTATKTTATPLTNAHRTEEITRISASQRSRYGYPLLPTLCATRGFTVRRFTSGGRTALSQTRLTRPTVSARPRVVLAKMASSGKQSHDHHDHDHDHDHDHGHGHSHGLFGHHHHHSPADNVFLTSKNKSDAGVRITRIGLLVNLLMAVSKGFGGWYFHSQALIADAMHALTDLVSDVMTLATVSWALKPPTKMFPNGFGKVESLGSLGVSSLLLFGGLAMGLNGVEMLYTQFTGGHLPAFLEGLGHSHSHVGLDHGHEGHDHGHSHSHSHSDFGPNINAAWLAGGSILVKEWLYRATMKIAKERKSSVLASNAVHHRIDSLTAMVALVSISLSNILNNAAWLDPVGGLLVSILVVRAGWANSRSALFELADIGLDDDMQADIKRVAESTLEEERLAGVAGSVKSVGGIKSGQNFLVDLTVALESRATLEDMARIEETMRRDLGEDVRGVRKVRIRFIQEGAEEASEFVEVKEGDLGSDSEDEHGHAHIHENGHKHEGKKHK
ncbi:hypothetical protein TWF696_004387 [Orbilia brochopaga]|uniref:Cation efflux protein transmembrane domain-containing protein n=1 Tax=Orbilia brochopaga TaxID=3140254 RepID=A0AAV9V6N3_9PEZI